MIAGTVLWWTSRGRRPALAPGLVAWGAAGVAAYQLAFFSAVRMAGAAVATVVALGSGPAWTGLLEWLTTRQPPTRTWCISTGVAVAGILLLVADPSTAASARPTLGVTLALVAGLSYASYTVAARGLITGGYSSSQAVGVLFGGGALLLAPVFVARWPGGLDHSGGIAVVGYLALVPTVVAYRLFGAGLRSLPASTVSTLTLADPVVAATLAIVLLGEPLTGLAAVAALIVLVGLGGLAAGSLPASARRSRDLRAHSRPQPSTVVGEPA